VTELTPADISAILSDPGSDLHQELMRRVEAVEAGERLYSSEEVRQILEKRQTEES
jgi:hypothetical protein